MRARDGFQALTEKEKQTLRLIVRGHDAKSTARSLGLSVHTINERLRDARRKLAVSSSREAARLLFEAEDGRQGPHPELSGDTEIGADKLPSRDDQDATSISGVERASRRSWIFGAFAMRISLALAAFAAIPGLVAGPPAPALADAARNPQIADAARQWLTLVDQGKWEESYRQTGAAFQKLNTLQLWETVSRKVRPPLGAVATRTFLSQDAFAAPPRGYVVVKFRTSFANQADAVESVTLEFEEGAWHVVAVIVE